MTMKKDSLLLAAVIVVFSFLTILPRSLADNTGDSIERPTWKIGDTWIYRVSLDGKPAGKLAMNVIAIAKEGYTVAVDRDDEKTREFYTRDLNFLKSEDISGNFIEGCGEGMPTFKWPLKIGESWSGSYLANDNRGNANPIILHVKVEKAETLFSNGKDVKVIKLIFTRENKDRIFLASREYWYNPGTGYLEKRLDKRRKGKDEVRELVSFTPGPK